MRASHNGVTEGWRKALNVEVTTALEYSELNMGHNVLGVVVWDDDMEEAHLTLTRKVKGNILMADAIVDVQALLASYYETYFSGEPCEAKEKSERVSENDNA